MIKQEADETEELVDLQDSADILKSLRQVNEDDTLSRVMCADMPVTRASGEENDSGFSSSPVDDLVNLSEEVTLCAASHVETAMSECISDGIEATDIGSLLEQFLEYEKAISPAMSPVTTAFPTPVASPKHESNLILEPAFLATKPKTQVDKFQNDLVLADTPPMTPTEVNMLLQRPKDEMADCDMIVDSQVTITTTSNDDDKLEINFEHDMMDFAEETEIYDTLANAVQNDITNTIANNCDCIVVNRNGIVVVEYRNNTNKNNNNDETKVVENNDIETNIIENNDKKENEVPNKLKSVIGRCYRIPKRPRSATRSRSRSPLRRSSQRSRLRSKSRSQSSSSDDDDDSDKEEKKERYERYQSERRRTPMRKDDRRKRRKYSSCSDDEYDYYRYSKRRHDVYRDQSPPRRSNNEHDYYQPKKSHKDYYRSNSARDRLDRGHSQSRRPRKSFDPDREDENVHERLSDLAKPVPYDIEQERKIGFLVKERRSGFHERRNVYAGGIKRNVSKGDVVRRFEAFGPVEKVTLHFRERGDNYAFIVFEEPKDAVRAVEEGNNDPNYDPLDICFGGRRKFVGGSYVDFDANISYLEENDIATTRPASPANDNEFDALLAMAKRQQSVE